MNDANVHSANVNTIDIAAAPKSGTAGAQVSHSPENLGSRGSQTTPTWRITTGEEFVHKLHVSELKDLSYRTVKTFDIAEPTQATQRLRLNLTCFLMQRIFLKVRELTLRTIKRT